jgi:transcriptional regulator with XRE-family HTH domain
MPPDDETQKNEPDQFPSRLKSARDLRGWNQAELAAKAGMPPSSIAHFEAGARKPSFDTLRRLATALSVTTDYLLGRVDSPVVAESGDPLFRDVANLTGNDRELAKDFVNMLAKRRQLREGGEG